MSEKIALKDDEESSRSSSHHPPTEIRHLRVVTLNAWCLAQPWPIGSKDRKERVELLVKKLNFEAYDIVALQEIWSEGDYLKLKEGMNGSYPYSHYFHSGFTGSGVCVFSRYPIVSTLTHRYSLNGFAHHVHRGDWFGGKVVGLTRIEIGNLIVHLYSTHLHAEYNRENDLFLPHRTAQSMELSQFVRHTALGADVIIVTGDLNLEPCDLGLRLILANAKLTDAWKVVHANETNSDKLELCRGIERGATCDRPDNIYTPKALKEKDESKRIDYILFRSGKRNVTVEECELTLNEIEDTGLNYSDHVGIHAKFAIGGNLRQDSSEWESNKVLLKEAIEVCTTGQTRARKDRFFFIALFFLFITIIIATLFIPVFQIFFSIVRFVLTCLSVFFIWYGFIGLTLERKSLKAAKQSMRQLLNDD